MILKYNKTNVFEAGEGVKFIPGVNTHIQKSDWEKCKSHPIVKIMIDEGHIEIVDDSETDGVKQVVNVLADLSPAKAIEFVKETVVIETLEAMLKKEKRKAVVKAIHEQLDDLNNVQFRTDEKGSDE